MAGYALRKHGTDIIAPGALAKVASKSLKSAKELATVCKNIKRAEEVLVLETATKIGNISGSGEIINSAKSTILLSEKLGFSSQELSQLKQIVKGESGFTNCPNSIKEIQNLNKLEKIMKMIDDYVRGKGKIITNSSGNMILIRGDKKIRFDVRSTRR